LEATLKYCRDAYRASDVVHFYLAGTTRAFHDMAFILFLSSAVRWPAKAGSAYVNRHDKTNE